MSTSISTTLDRDWFDEPVDARPHFVLKLDEGTIVLSASVAKSPLIVAGDDGSFREGLWNGDCAELFLSNPETGYYLEFNLSPLGGWWRCDFSAPRRRVEGSAVPLAGVTTRGSTASDRWSAELRIPVASLPEALAFSPEATMANVTFCLGDTPQRYLTLVDLGGGDPDFHRPSRWSVLFSR